jgi:uncharacterized protein (DUF433 family)
MYGSELLTVSEAAVVAGVEVRDVNRMIDEDILPKELVKERDGRWIEAKACAFVDFYVHTAATLTAEARLNVISSALKKMNAYKSGSWASSARVRKDALIDVDLVVSVNFDRFVFEAKTRLDRLEEARAAIETDGEVLGGIPVFKDTRIPVRDVAASMKKGIAKERILRAYPALKESMLELAVIYADANPPRGRPRENRRRS